MSPEDIHVRSACHGTADFTCVLSSGGPYLPYKRDCGPALLPGLDLVVAIVSKKRLFAINEMNLKRTTSMLCCALGTASFKTRIFESLESHHHS